MSEVEQVNVDRLKMIQDIISRLAGESAHLKAYAATITAAVIVLVRFAAHPPHLWPVVLVLIPLALLDVYYLGLERLYRDLYKTATRQGPDEWSLAVDPSRGAALKRGAVSLVVPAFYLALVFVSLMAMFRFNGAVPSGQGR